MVCPRCQGWMVTHASLPKHRKCSCGYTCHEKADTVKNLLTCNGCHWVHFGVSRWFAEDAVLTFNEYYNTLTEDEKKEYYGNTPASMLDYETCHRCGGSYKDFRPSKVDDMPDGCTMNPIISES